MVNADGYKCLIQSGESKIGLLHLSNWSKRHIPVVDLSHLAATRSKVSVFEVVLFFLVSACVLRIFVLQMVGVWFDGCRKSF